MTERELTIKKPEDAKLEQTLWRIYFSVYISSFIIFKAALNSEEIKKMHDPVLDALRYNVPSGAGATFYAAMGSAILKKVLGDTRFELSKNQRNALSAAITIGVLTLYEMKQSTFPNRSFDNGDMLAYAMGLCVFLFAEPLIKSVKERGSWSKRADDSKSSNESPGR